MPGLLHCKRMFELPEPTFGDLDCALPGASMPHTQQLSSPDGKRCGQGHRCSGCLFFVIFSIRELHSAYHGGSDSVLSDKNILWHGEWFANILKQKAKQFLMGLISTIRLAAANASDRMPLASCAAAVLRATSMPLSKSLKIGAMRLIASTRRWMCKAT